MIKYVAMIILFFSNIAYGSEVQIKLFEESTKKTTNYIFNADSSALHKIANSYGSELPIIDRYVLHNRQLYLRDKPITHADEILYQGQLDGADLVVIRDEYNSRSNPWRLFAYSLGHPIQVSKIIVLVIKDGVLKTQKEITRKAASYHWEVKVSR